MPIFVGFIAFVVLVFAIWIYWRFGSGPRPCPTSLIPLLDNPFTHRYHRDILLRLEFEPGHRVLDAGCGPGLLTVPIAQAIAPNGRVTALDIQPGMLERAKARVAAAGLSNVDFLQSGLGEGKLPANFFDRALLVTVLGEIHNKLAALQEIHSALKPGGFLSVTEVLPDPDYQSATKVKEIGEQAGFVVRNRQGNFFIYTLNLEKIK